MITIKRIVTIYLSTLLTCLARKRYYSNRNLFIYCETKTIRAFNRFVPLSSRILNEPTILISGIKSHRGMT